MADLRPPGLFEIDPKVVFATEPKAADLLKRGYRRLPSEYQRLLHAPAWHPAWGEPVHFLRKSPVRDRLGEFSRVNSRISIDPYVQDDPVGTAAHELVHAITSRQYGQSLLSSDRQTEEYLADRLGKWLHPPFVGRSGAEWGGYGFPGKDKEQEVTDLDAYLVRRLLNYEAEKTMNPLMRALNDLLGGGR